jgi:hypothetical protein
MNAPTKLPGSPEARVGLIGEEEELPDIITEPFGQHLCRGGCIILPHRKFPAPLSVYMRRGFGAAAGFWLRWAGLARYRPLWVRKLLFGLERDIGAKVLCHFWSHRY